MKKQIASLLMSVVSLGCLGCSVACTDGNDKSSEQTQKSETVTLANFEQWAPDFQILRLMGKFGAVNVNTDAQYVKGGKQSAKLQPTGGYVKKTLPFLYVNTVSELFGYDYSNFSGVTSLSAWLYNAQTEAKEVNVGVVTYINDISSVERIFGASYSLMPGWNKVVYYPDLPVMNLSADITSIKGLYFEFENAGVIDLADAPVYYLDEVEIKREKDPEPLQDIITLKPGEILDFEEDWQMNAVTPDITYSSAQSSPDLSIVRASDYGITATSGEKVLKVVTHRGQNYLSAWPKFSISEKIIQKSGFNKIPKEEWKDYRFAFDVYSEKEGFLFYPELYNSSQTRYNSNFTTKSGQWVTVTESFTTHSFSGWTDEHITSPGSWKIAWDEYTNDGDIVFFFDNFRFEKIENN